MNPPISLTPTEPQSVTRVRVFVDYWNFQLTFNGLEASERGLDDYRFKIAWAGLGSWLAQKACESIRIDPKGYSFDGVIIYASYNPQTAEGRGFRKWATTWLDSQALPSNASKESPRLFPSVLAATGRLSIVLAKSAVKKSLLR